MNLLFLVPGQVGGSEPYLTNLVRAMLESEHRFTLFTPRGFKAAYGEIAGGCELVEAPWSSGAQARRIVAENSWLSFVAGRRRLDLLHHGGGTSPFLKSKPAVVTIHDIQYRHYPENFVKAKRVWLRVNVPWSAKRNEAITVPSDFVKRDLVSAFDIDPLKVVIVPFGTEGLLATGISEDETRRRYDLERPYFLFPARTYPHKNHAGLIEAFAVVSPEADLVLTGAPWFRDKAIDLEAERRGMKERVRRLGSIPRQDLAGLYRGATALVFPSRFEGFGVPILEAMSVGCPVVCSNTTALPEVAGEAAITLDPDDLLGWTKTMQDLLGDEALRRGLIQRGIERAAHFTWKHSAQQQISAYEMAKA